MIDSKTQLAKLLATENITVRQTSEAKTASFDVRNRVLTLPNWNFDDTVVLDLLIGHEVGHALWTLDTDWESALAKGLHKGITNVVEDARIEKRIKQRYPGLVRCMVSGYRILESKGFFYEDIDSIEHMNLIDRINLHFKLGAMANIPFSETEEYFVNMVSDCNTWEDVEKSVIALMEYLGSVEEDFTDPAVSSEPKLGEELGDGEEEDDFLSMSVDEEEDDDEEEEAGEEENGTGEEKSENSLSGDIEELRDYLDDFLDVDTQSRFDDSVIRDALNEMDALSVGPQYYTLPKFDMKNGLVSYTDFHKELNTRIETARQLYKTTYAYSKAGKNIFDSTDYRTFKREAVKIVGYMAKEFERKKSAAEYRKESVSKTGVLDMTKVHQYKYNEDLFLRNTVRPNGKNHGMILMLDWSASMSCHMHDSMKQLLSLVWFCQKVNIPFEVYAFSNSWCDWEAKGYKSLKEWIDNEGADAAKVWRNKPGNAYFGNVDGEDAFRLMNILSSKMNAKQSNLAMVDLFNWSRATNGHYWGSCDLSSTPLLESMVALDVIIPNFQEANNLDITNVMVITDGEGNGSWTWTVPEYEEDKGHRCYGRDTRLVDMDTKREYTTKDIEDYENKLGCGHGRFVMRYQNVLNETQVTNYLKDKYKINTIGLFIDGNSSRSLSKKTIEKYLGWRDHNLSKWTKLRSEVKKTGVAKVKRMGYDDYYLVPVGKLKDESEELEIDNDWSAAKIKNAFAKNLTQRFGNKVLVNKMIDIIA